MSTSNKTNLSVNDLDFDSIKSSLKSYLGGQTAFADYNFEGAGINILLDALAYNTHYEAFYNNMIANEMFLDSAADRSNVVSHAKHLGYTPTSVRGSEATVSITLGSTVGYTESYYIPRGEQLSASKDGVSYNFSVKTPVKIDLAAEDGYHFTNVVVQQGVQRSQSFIYDSNDPRRKFIIPENNADTSTFRVRVQNSVTDSTGFTDLWDLASNFNDLTSTSKSYFLQEVEDNKYEIYFGDGVIGKALENGNLVTVNYLVAEGPITNDIGQRDTTSSRSFTYGSGNTVVVVSKASGGANRESIESIRFRAPLGYQAQNRAVTVRDYQSILVSDYPDVESVSVWGGEDNLPPDFGAVYIAFKPQSGLIIPETRKTSIADSILKTKNIVGMRVNIVDPDYTYIRVGTTVNYNPDLSSVQSSSLQALVSGRIRDYTDTYLEKFSKGLRYSKLLKEIDDTDESILSNETEIVMEKRYSPNNNEEQSFSLDFNNPIYHPHDGHMAGVVKSSRFIINTSGGTQKTVFLEDDGSGKLRMVEDLVGDTEVINDSAGSVDYEAGIVTLLNTNISEPTDFEDIRVRALPAEKDIDSDRRTILVIDANDSDAVNVVMNAEIPGVTVRTTRSTSSTASTSASRLVNTTTTLSTGGGYSFQVGSY